MSFPFPSLFAAVALALVHVATPSLRILDGTPRSFWLSFAGGVSVAYVFVHLLPELAAGQAHVAAAVRGAPPFLERHVWLIALAGLLVFYGLDRMAKRSRARLGGTAAGAARDRGGPSDEAGTEPGVFLVHLASFAVYNVLVGYLLLRRGDASAGGLVFFTVAMALHFVVTDYGLNEDHRAPYRRVGRWVLVMAVATGWALGATVELSEAAVAALTAFLGGGVVLNVLKEGVPSERQSRFAAFVLGAAGYAGLLLTL